MINGDLILIRGVSGAGKSTIANLFNSTDDNDLKVLKLCTDDFFMKLCGCSIGTESINSEYCPKCEGKRFYYDFQPEKLASKHQECINKVKETMVLQEEVHTFCKKIIIHNTFTQEWEMAPYFDIAYKYDWRVHTIIVENRHCSRSVHDVPDESIKSQRKRFKVVL